MRRAALLQPIKPRTTAGADFWQNGGHRGALRFKTGVTCIKNEKSSRIFTSMKKSTYNIRLHGYYNQADRCGGGKGPGWNVWDCGSRFICITDQLLLEHCRSCVLDRVAGHSDTDVMMPVAWLWRHARVRRSRWHPKWLLLGFIIHRFELSIYFKSVILSRYRSLNVVLEERGD